MNKLQLIILLIFIAVFSLRVFTQGGFDTRKQVSDFEAISYNFLPLRDFLSSQAENLLPEPQASLLTGMTIGAQSTLPPDFKKALQNTSTIHIVVVSGQNLTLVAGFVMGFASYLGRKKTIMLSLVVIIFYSLLTGFQIPTLRAAIMVGLSSIAQLFNREREGTWVLVLTAFAMLIYNPNWLFSISFQLSFLATIGVMELAPELLKKLTSFPDLVKQDLAVSFAAQLLTLPILAINFHQVSIIGLLVNSLILWTVPLIMITGMAALFMGAFSLVLGQLFALVPGVFLTYFVYIINFFNQDWGYISVWNNNLVFWAGYYLVIFSVLLFLKKSNSKGEVDLKIQKKLRSYY